MFYLTLFVVKNLINRSHQIKSAVGGPCVNAPDNETSEIDGETNLKLVPDKCNPQRPEPLCLDL